MHRPVGIGQFVVLIETVPGTCFGFVSYFHREQSVSGAELTFSSTFNTGLSHSGKFPQETGRRPTSYH